jgi:DNA-binding NtrC family response regulator
MDNNKTVLVIDDNPEVVEALETFLSMRDYLVISATDGRDGVDLAMEQQPDVVVCDYKMPDFDGFSVLKALRRHDATVGIPFILFTSHGGQRLANELAKVNATTYLDKGDDPGELVDVIERVLDASKLNGESDG